MPRSSVKKKVVDAPKEEVAAPSPSAAPDNLESLSRKDLQQLAKSLGVKANGKNSEIIEAIQEARAGVGGSVDEAKIEEAPSSSKAVRSSTKKQKTPGPATAAATPKLTVSTRKKSVAAPVPSSTTSSRTSTVKKTATKSAGRSRRTKVIEEVEDEGEEEAPAVVAATPAAPASLPSKAATSKASAAAAAAAAKASDEEDEALKDMPRAKLQSLAKSLGVKANGKTADLIASIREKRGAATTTTEMQTTEEQKPKSKATSAASPPKAAATTTTIFEDSPPPVASLSDHHEDAPVATTTNDDHPQGVQEEAAAKRRLSLLRQMKENRQRQLGQVKNKKLSKTIREISKSKTRNSPRLHRLPPPTGQAAGAAASHQQQQQHNHSKPVMPAREKENLRMKLNNERLDHAVKSLQGNTDSRAHTRSPVKSDGVRKAQAMRREGFMADAKSKRENAFDRARQVALQSLTEGTTS